MNWKILLCIRNVLGTRPTPAAPQAPSSPIPPAKPPKAPRPAAITHRYPAIDAGLDATLTIDELLEGQKDLLSGIKLGAGGGQAFHSLYYPAIVELTSWIHALPANESGNHFGAGGLLRLSLELAFHCLQVADQSLFARSEPTERRRQVEPCWRFAAFLAGLYSELHVIPIRMHITADNGSVWPCHTTPLKEFIEQQKTQAYFVRFKPADHSNREMSALFAHRLISQRALQYLQDGHHMIVPTLMASLGGKTISSEHQKLQEILESVRLRVIRADLARQPSSYGKVKVGVHLEPYLLDAMRSLVRDGVWRINEPKERLWFTNEGLFLFWKTGFQELLAQLKTQKIPGAPINPETVAEILLAERIIVPGPDGRAYWPISAPGSDRVFDGLKFADPLSLLGDTDIQPIKESVTGQKKSTARKKKDEKPKSADLFSEDPTNSTLMEASATELETGPVASEVVPDEDGLSIVSEAKLQEELIAKDAIVDESDLTFCAADWSTAEALPTPSVATVPQEQSGLEKQPTSSIDSLLAAVSPAGASPSGLTAAASALPVSLSVSEHAEKLLRQLGDETISDFLRAMIIDIEKGNISDSVQNSFGIGIKRSLIPTYGVEESTVLSCLSSVGWLAVNPEKPNAKYHKIDINGTPTMFLLLYPKVASGLGMKGHINV